MKSFSWNTIEFCKPSFGIWLEWFNAIDRAITRGQFILTMIHTGML